MRCVVFYHIGTPRCVQGGRGWKLFQNMLRTRHDLLLVLDNSGNELDTSCRHIDLKSGE